MRCIWLLLLASTGDALQFCQEYYATGPAHFELGFLNILHRILFENVAVVKTFHQFTPTHFMERMIFTRLAIQTTNTYEQVLVS